MSTDVCKRPQTLHVYLDLNGARILCGIEPAPAHGPSVVTVGRHGFKVYSAKKYAQVYTPCAECEARYPLVMLDMMDL
jgi:DNA transposition AAA+ family ATPase